VSDVGHYDELQAQIDDLGIETDPTLTADVEIAGRAWNPAAPPCQHRATYTQQVVVAPIPDPDGGIDHWEAQLEIRCGNCAMPFDIATEGRKPRDGRPGVVVILHPSEGA
jgi:hypothetical protein